jgi:hypothetical protein
MFGTTSGSKRIYERLRCGHVETKKGKAASLGEEPQLTTRPLPRHTPHCGG